MTFFSSKKIFVIAEMANAHEGNLSKAIELTKSAHVAGADAIKYQKFTADELAEPAHEYYNLYKKLEMKNTEWKKLITYAKKLKLKVFVDVFGLQSAKSISKFSIDGYKLHSSDISNPILLEYFSKTSKPILLSSGGCHPNEIDEAVKILSKKTKEIIIMHGFQAYPTKLKDLRLSRILEIKRKFGLPVGLMDHISGDSELATIIPLVGISMGATIIEKHITLDRKKKGLDYYSALNPKEFTKLVSAIRKVETSLGNNNFILSPNEINYRLAHKKNTISKKLIKKGTKINGKMFEFKRTKKKQHSTSFFDFNERTTLKNIPKGTVLKNSMIDNNQRIAAVIACRVDSDRLFAKPLQHIDKYRIIDLLLKQIRKSKLISDIVLGISDKPGNEIFVDYAKENKIKFVTGDDIDVLQRLIDGANYVNAGIVFRVTSENPFIYWEGIDELIKKHLSQKNDFSFCMDIPLGSGYELINLRALEESHNSGSKKHRSELCSLYINEHKEKFKIYRHLPPKTLQRSELRLTVDNPEDLQVVRIIHKYLGKNDNPIPLKKIIEFLDKNENVRKINSDILVSTSRIWI